MSARFQSVLARLWGQLLGIAIGLALGACAAPRVPSVFTTPPASGALAHAAYHAPAAPAFKSLMLPAPVVGFWRSPAILAKPDRALGAPAIVSIYIEGDGAAWRDRTQAPSDPTPTDPLAAHLAHVDPADWVVYLGRPCQYLKEEERMACDPQWWQAARYGDTVIALMQNALGSAIQQIESDRQARFANPPPLQVRLIGYSGGGVIATFIAQERLEVECLITVAAPLDITAWTSGHGVSPLSQSRNPARLAALRAVPQTHWYGQADRVVPHQAIGSYPWRALSDRAQVHVLAGFDHRAPWAEQWPTLLARSCPKRP